MIFLEFSAHQTSRWKYLWIDSCICEDCGETKTKQSSRKHEKRQKNVRNEEETLKIPRLKGCQNEEKPKDEAEKSEEAYDEIAVFICLHTCVIFLPAFANT